MIPKDRMLNAFSTFAFALKIWDNCHPQNAFITPRMFEKQLIIKTGGKGVIVEAETLRQKALEDRSYNLMLSALSTLSLVIDEASDEIWGKNKGDDELSKARLIVHQIRNAFAHEPIEPKWEIHKKNQKQIHINIEDVSIMFGGDVLNGKNFKPDDVGGFEGFITLIKFIINEAIKQDQKI